MKATLLFATLSMVFAMPHVSAKTELETLRARCAEQEQRIRQLEDQLRPQRENRSETTTPAPRTTVAPDASASSASSSCIVKPGDSVEKIARRHHCSVSNLNKLNGLKASSIIHPGQRLKLPANPAVVATTNSIKSASPVKSPTANALAEQPPATAKIHKIKQGETYSSISRKYRIPIHTLVAANPGIKATALCPGMNIRLSSDAAASAGKHTSPTVTEVAAKSAVSKAPSSESIAKPVAKTTPVEKHTSAVAANPEKSEKLEASELQQSTTAPVPSNPESAASSGNNAIPAITEGPKTSAANTPAPSPNPNPEKKIRSVKIEDQMTYGQFAAKHGTDPGRLNDLNGLDLTTATVLAKGSELYVPAQP